MFTAQIWETRKYKLLRQREMELNNKGQHLDIIIQNKSRSTQEDFIISSSTKY